MGAPTWQDFFQNFEVDMDQILQNFTKLALITKILKKILKTWRNEMPEIGECSGDPIITSSSLLCGESAATILMGEKVPRTHKICDIKNFWTKFGDFCKIWILVKFVKFEILNPKISKFEILNPNTKISNLDTKFLNFDDFCYKFEENFAEIDKIGDISKFEILNPKIQNLKSLTLKSKIFDFDKIWPKIKIPPRWFIITLRFHQNSMVKIFQNWSQYGRTNVTNFFQNFEVDIKIQKSPKLAQITKILKKILKTYSHD